MEGGKGFGVVLFILYALPLLLLLSGLIAGFIYRAKRTRWALIASFLSLAVLFILYPLTIHPFFADEKGFERVPYVLLSLLVLVLISPGMQSAAGLWIKCFLTGVYLFFLFGGLPVYAPGAVSALVLFYLSPVIVGVLIWYTKKLSGPPYHAGSGSVCLNGVLLALSVLTASVVLYDANPDTILIPFFMKSLRSPEIHWSAGKALFARGLITAVYAVVTILIVRKMSSKAVAG